MSLSSSGGVLCKVVSMVVDDRSEWSGAVEVGLWCLGDTLGG